jgi:DNA-binding transcriptional regulator YdaS (Cro superfamily)
MAYAVRANTPPAAIDAAIEAIATNGSYAAGARLLGISTQSFQYWRDTDETLAARCKKAIARRFENHDVVKRALAEDIATKTLREGVKEVTTVEREAIVQLTGEIVTLVETREVHKPAPLKLVERYLNSDFEEMAMIKALVLGGFLPDAALGEIENALAQFKQAVTGTIQPQGEGSQIARIPQDQLIDAATRAIQRVFTENPVDVSAEVVARPEPGEDSGEV